MNDALQYRQPRTEDKDPRSEPPKLLRAASEGVPTDDSLELCVRDARAPSDPKPFFGHKLQYDQQILPEYGFSKHDLQHAFV